MQFPSDGDIKSAVSKSIEDEIEERTYDHNCWIISHRGYGYEVKYNFIKEIENKLKKCKDVYSIKTYIEYTDRELELIKELFHFNSFEKQYTGNYKNDEFTYTFITKDEEQRKIKREIEHLHTQLNEKLTLLKKSE